MKYTIENIKQGHHKTTYRGVECIKCPFDYIIYQMLIFKLKPDLIIEVGTRHGGSALYYQDLLNIIGNGGQVHTIDIENKSNRIKNVPGITRFYDGYQKYNIELAKGFDKVLVIEDASHMYEDVVKTYEKFKNVVTIGSYFIIEDSAISELSPDVIKRFNGGPLRAINEIMNKNKNYKIDRSLCDFYGPNYTFNIDGYLKRIK